MSEPPADDKTRREFVRRAQLDAPEVVGARWWNESFEAFQGNASRRDLLRAIPWLVGGGIGAGILGAVYCDGDDDDDGIGAIQSLEALDLQRREGWNAGQPGMSLHMPLELRDSEGGAAWVSAMEKLSTLLEPDAHLRRLANYTLFQSLAEPMNNSLRAAIRPVQTPEADEVAARGRALLGLADMEQAPRDLALVVDLPGPLSVAFAAAVSPRFCPVFLFDNWPHPLGVVPSHLTLGACLYQLPLLLHSRSTRQQPAPPMFVLDASRLNPYREQGNLFDNRYLAPVPSASALQGLGCKRILYVRPDDQSLVELDDLNQDFVDWQRAGLDVRALALTDFRTAEAGTRRPPDAGAATATVTPGATAPYYYGGHSHHHLLFWHSYGYGYGLGAAPAPSRRLRSSPPPARLSAAPAYRPTPRPTMFSSRTVGGLAGLGKQKPSGFGRVSVRSGFAANARRSRSGSFGRSRSSSFG